MAPVVAALQELMKTYTVMVRKINAHDCDCYNPYSHDGKACVGDVVELNAIDAKIVRELSKRNRRDAVIEPMRRAARTFRRIASLAREQIEALSKYETLLVQAHDAFDYTTLRQAIADYKTAYNVMFGGKDRLESCLQAFVAESRLVPELVSAYPRHREILALIESALPDLQQICLGCSRTSDDDNLSNHGQTFVSIDAMATIGLAAASESPSDIDDEKIRKAHDADTAVLNDPDDQIGATTSDSAYRSFYDSTSSAAVAQSAHDYLLSHTSPDAIRPKSCGTVTTLPSHVEDFLREHLASFASLTVFEQLLCFSQWSGQTFSDFATMKWVPTELLKPQSKQFITNRWNRLVQKFPLADALKKATPTKSVSSALSRHYAEQAFECGEFNLDVLVSPSSEIIDLF